MERFSDLEVAPDGEHGANEHGRLDPSPLNPVPKHEESTMPEAVPWEYRKNGMSVLPNGDNTMPEAVLLENRGNEIHSAGKETELRTPSIRLLFGQPRRRCGMPIRVFYGVLVLVVLLVIGGVAGGVAGGLITTSKSQDEEDPTTASTTAPTTTPNIHISATSKLSATNWTNPFDGTLHRFVFFQDPFNAMIMRRWNSTTGVWTTNNLTNIFSQTKNPINALTPSTPLASVSSSWRDFNKLHIYYVAPDHSMTGAVIQDLVNASDTWAFDNLAGATFTTFPGSQIAVAWQRDMTHDVEGWWALAWQNSTDGAVWLANATDFLNPRVAIAAGEAVHGTSLALIPEVQYFTPTLNRLTMMCESLSSPTTGIVKKFTYITSWASDGIWLAGGIPPPAAGPQFALTRFDNWTTVYFLALLPNGTITGDYYAHGRKRAPIVTLVGGPSDVNFSAIAASEESMVYGISGDTVLQYSVKFSDPSVLQFEGAVFP
ncbi:hypothetical protein ANO14919_039440 [Xylariales sp. No.14919]|nr:hypothetical protein ANO14919_039440 [Xylariales sp. No.14919]